MATHFSILAWKIPWTEEPGRLQFMGSQSWTRLMDFTFTFDVAKEAITGNTAKQGEDPPEGGNGNPLQYSCLENSMDRGAWKATVHGTAKSRR